MSDADRPLSERFRLAALEWADLDAAARMLEECKSAFLSQRKVLLGDVPDSRAETAVKASDAWTEYLRDMVNARSAANRARVEVDYLKMQFSERQSAEASARAERRM